MGALRVPRAQVEQRLQTDDGLVKFLKPNWVGDAKVVLTTYETLRDFEFSFAVQKWSLMVCDEAQRIKNPAAMVTRASPKAPARASHPHSKQYPAKKDWPGTKDRPFRGINQAS